MATLQIPNHSHCVICSQAVPFGDKTCTDKCQKDLDDLNKRRKRSVLIMYVLMAVAMGILILSSTGLMGGQ